MGRQCTKAIFVGTCANLNGYVDDGKPIARLVDRKDRRKAGALAASKAFGKISKAAAVEWGKIPQGMRRLGGEGAFNEWVSACHGLRNEGSYYWDWAQLEGMVFGDAAGSCGAGSSGSEFGPRSGFGDEDEKYSFDYEGIRCWEAPSAAVVRSAISGGKLDFSSALASVRRALKPYREGVDAQWRLGAMPRRDGHYDLGNKFNPYRGPAFYYEGDARDRAWNEKHAKGVYKGYEHEIFDHGWGIANRGLEYGGVDGPRMPKRWKNFRDPKQKGVALKKGAIRVRFWLQVVAIHDLNAVTSTVVGRTHHRVGRGWVVPGYCTAWVDLDAWDGPVLDLTDLQEKLSVLVEDRDVLVFAGVEVSEKRVRHWVRLPWACGLSLVVAGSVGEMRERVAPMAKERPVRRNRAERAAKRARRVICSRQRHGGGNFRHFSGP